MALMVLNGGDMFEKVRDLMKECEEKDQENHSTIAWDHFEKMFWGYSKALFSDEERNTVVQLLIDNFKEGTKFRYSKADEHGMPLLIDTLIKFRADIITKGLVENDRNKLESYLLEYLETFDTEKTGFLNQAQLLQALRKCPKLKLVELEYLILTQLCPKNAQGDFNYREHSFDIMIYLKMLFEPKNIKRRATYYKSTVMRSDNIQAYTLDTIRESCLKVFQEFQVEALSYEHYYSIFDGLTNIKVTEKEKQEAFYLLDTNQDEFIDEAELTENCQHLHYFLVRNETIENLKNNFIVV